MNDLNRILTEATEAIEELYFLLPIAGGEPIYRERVYCYELYHQMRVIWPPDCEYCLNGEVNKGGHQILNPLGVSGSPDFLVHRPGDMLGNHAIIEVKSSEADKRGIRADLTKLSHFVTRAGYQRAIYLIYGNEAANLVPEIQRIAQEIDGPLVELWLHSDVHQRAERGPILRSRV